MAVGLLRNGHIYSILEEGSTTPPISLAGNVGRLMVGSEFWLRTLKLAVPALRSKLAGQGRAGRWKELWISLIT